MKLKIISDGTIAGTQVINAENGERVENVQAVSWRGDVNGSLFSEGTIRIMAMEAEITSEFKHDAR